MTTTRRSLIANPGDLKRSSAGDGESIEIRERSVSSSGQIALQSVAREAWTHALRHPASSLEGLTSALSTIFGRDGLPGEVTVLNRKPNDFASTFHTEIVTCRLPDGSERKVLCKHAVGDGHNCYGHRGGIRYEAEVYRSVLAGIPLTTAAFYGDHVDADKNQAWLVLEFLEDAPFVKDLHENGAMTLAARWIGRFHAMNEARVPSARMRFLTRYNADYYLGWSHRTWQFAEPLRDQYPWLEEACETYAEAVDWLLARPQTVIHGEYYSINVLIAGAKVYPVDWESAAVAVGEIDLACVTERWPEEKVREMELEYQRARWPEGAPAEFARTLAAARLYLIFRWLGDRPEWTTSEQFHWRFEQLRLAIERWKSSRADQSRSWIAL